MKVLIRNKKAYFNYEVLDKFEAGIKLLGWEVKSIQFGSANIGDGFVQIDNGEVFLYEVNISRWKTQSVHEKINTRRRRKLLLKKNEIAKLDAKIKQRGFSIVPIRMYMSNNQKVKVEIALVRGKKQYEKRTKLKEKDMKHTIERDIEHYNAL